MARVLSAHSTFDLPLLEGLNNPIIFSQEATTLPTRYSELVSGAFFCCIFLREEGLINSTSLVADIEQGDPPCDLPVLFPCPLAIFHSDEPS